MLSRREALLTTILSPLTKFLTKKQVTRPVTIRERVAAINKLFETNAAVLHLKLTDNTEKFYKSYIDEHDDKIVVSMENLDGTMKIAESFILNTDLQVIAKCNVGTVTMCHGDKLLLNYRIVIT